MQLRPLYTSTPRHFKIMQTHRGGSKNTGKSTKVEQWMRTKPMMPGFYWVRCDEGRKTRPEVKEFAVDELPHGNGGIEPVYGPYSTEGWDWFSGPIPPPVGWGS